MSWNLKNYWAVDQNWTNQEGEEWEGREGEHCHEEEAEQTCSNKETSEKIQWKATEFHNQSAEKGLQEGQ